MLLVIGQWIQITGVDLSERMLGHCRDKLAREPAEVQARVQLVRADLRRFDLGRTFALITIPFRPFQYLITLEHQLACLACVQSHLDTGGHFVVDVFSPDLRQLVHLSSNPEYQEEPPLSDARWQGCGAEAQKCLS